MVLMRAALSHTHGNATIADELDPPAPPCPAPRTGWCTRLAGVVALVLACCGVTPSAWGIDDYRFELTFSPQVRKEPFTGSVYLFFTKFAQREPRLGPDWFSPEPFARLEVTDWKPNEKLIVGSDDERLIAFPRPLNRQELAGLRVQAVARFNPWDRRVGNGDRNGFSAVATMPPLAAASETAVVPLTLDKLQLDTAFPGNQWCREFVVKSELLSKFHGHDVSLKAALHLPASYHDSKNRRYPVIFSIPGFSGTHFHGVRSRPFPDENAQGVEYIRVVLDPSAPLGHHVFADSDNNGPVGRALITEFIPALDRELRTIAEPTARFVTGHSSGGWSSLWLQVTYPDTFGGVWSTAPDPVDFRDFQRINIYKAGENMYTDADGARRPLARSGETVRLWYDGFDRMEEALGPGGQLHSFEAVFSPKATDGRPRRLWDRKTGTIDANVARHWERYDIALVLERNWTTLGPKLKGKLKIYMGDKDTFYLEGATRLLAERLQKLGSDAEVEMIPDRDHFNLLSQGLMNRIRSSMTDQFLRHHKP